MIFLGHSRIGTLGSCVEAVVVVMLCVMKGDGSLYVLVFSSFLGTELAFVFHFGSSHIFLICCCWGAGLIPLPFAPCVWLILTELVFITLSFWSNGLRGI